MQAHGLDRASLDDVPVLFSRTLNGRLRMAAPFANEVQNVHAVERPPLPNGVFVPTTNETELQEPRNGAHDRVERRKSLAVRNPRFLLIPDPP